MGLHPPGYEERQTPGINVRDKADDDRTYLIGDIAMAYMDVEETGEDAAESATLWDAALGVSNRRDD